MIEVSVAATEEALVDEVATSEVTEAAAEMAAIAEIEVAEGMIEADKSVWLHSM